MADTGPATAALAIRCPAGRAHRVFVARAYAAVSEQDAHALADSLCGKMSGVRYHPTRCPVMAAGYTGSQTIADRPLRFVRRVPLSRSLPRWVNSVTRGRTVRMLRPSFPAASSAVSPADRSYSASTRPRMIDAVGAISTAAARDVSRGCDPGLTGCPKRSPVTGQASGAPKNTAAGVSASTFSTASAKAWSNDRSARYSSNQNFNPSRVFRYRRRDAIR